MNYENQDIEYKEIWKDEYLKWVSGFANAHGGKIYIGIADDMKIVGVDKLHQLMEDIPNKIINATGVMPETNHIVKEGKDIIEIVIDPCGMPISYRGSYYYRSGATKQELRGQALHQFLLKKMGTNWEDIPCEGVTLDDIDDGAISYFLRHAVNAKRMSKESLNSSKEEVLENLGLLRDGIVTNGAVLVFGKYPQRRFVTSGFKIGRFGVDNSDLLNQDVVEGNLIQMTDKVIQILSDKYLIRPIHYEGLQRVEPLEVPEEALREIIFNSVVHKIQIGTWNQMSIYDDHIRLWNEGELPDKYTIDTLLGKHTSKPRNPRIANVFYKAGFIESWGRGYEKIMREFAKANLTSPTFNVEQGGFSVIISRDIFMATRAGMVTQSGTSQKATGNRPESDRKTDQKNKIIEIIKRRPSITRAELAVELNIHESSVKRRIEMLVKENRIKRIGPANGGYWVVVK